LPTRESSFSGLEDTVGRTPTQDTGGPERATEYIPTYDSNYVSTFERLEEIEIDSLDKVATGSDMVPRTPQDRGLISQDSSMYAPTDSGHPIRPAQDARFVRPEDDLDRFKKYKPQHDILPADARGIIKWKKAHDKYYSPAKRVDVK
jgi:hypothetical protein